MLVAIILLISHIDWITENPTPLNTEITQVHFNPVNTGLSGNVSTNFPFFPGLNHLSILQQAAFSSLRKMDLQGYAFIDLDLIPHSSSALFPLSVESKPTGRCRNIIPDEAMPVAKGIQDHVAVLVEISTQWLLRKNMGIHSPKMKFVREQRLPYRADRNMERMSIRPKRFLMFFLLEKNMVILKIRK